MDTNNNIEDEGLRILKIAYWFKWLIGIIGLVVGILAYSYLVIVFSVSWLIASWFSDFIYSKTIKYLIGVEKKAKSKEKLTALKVMKKRGIFRW